MRDLLAFPSDDLAEPAPASHETLAATSSLWSLLGLDDTAPVADADGGPLLRGDPAASAGEAVSTTCLAHFTPPHKWQFLACGVDSLDFSLGIQWGDDWEATTATLAQLKESAAGTHGVLSPDSTHIIRPSGKPPSYAWHLEWPEFHLYLGKSPTPQGKNPNGLVAFNSKGLWSQGVRGVVSRLVEELDKLGGTVLGLKPSRVDLAADFLIPEGLTLAALLTMRVPSHLQHSHFERGDHLETFYQGSKKSPIQLRLYNKGEEVLQGGTKLWFLDVWNLKSASNVWRVEFQLRRQVLRQFKVETLEDLERKLGGLWTYLTEWFSLRERDDSNTTRRTLHPWWKDVAACADRFGPALTLQREFLGEPADSAWYVSHCAGCLASFAACEGLDEFDDAATLLFARIANYWKPREFESAVAIKSIRLGVSPTTSLSEVSQHKEVQP